MGAQMGCDANSVESKDTVKLNIYDLFGNRIIEEANKVFRAVGTGAFHVGVEVFGKEYSFGFCESGSGVFECEPKKCGEYKFRESVNMGDTDVAEDAIVGIIEKLSAEWPGASYDLLRKNCTEFSKALCKALHVNAVPAWVTNLSGAGATLDKGIKDAAVKGGEAVDKAKVAAILAAAKAGKVDEEYKISGTVQATAKELLFKAGELEQKYQLQQHADILADKVQGHAAKLSDTFSRMFAPKAGGSPASK